MKLFTEHLQIMKAFSIHGIFFYVIGIWDFFIVIFFATLGQIMVSQFQRVKGIRVPGLFIIMIIGGSRKEYQTHIWWGKNACSYRMHAYVKLL